MGTQQSRGGRNRKSRKSKGKTNNAWLDQPPHFDPEKLLSLAEERAAGRIYDASVVREAPDHVGVAFRDDTGQEVR